MRPLFTILCMIVGLVSQLTGQDAMERKISMSLGLQNAFYVEIPGADDKTAEKTFYEFVKEYGKLKENKKAKEHFMMATKIPVINGTSPIDLFAKFEEGKGMATTYVWIDLGGSFVNSSDHASQTAAVRQFMYDYFIAVRKKVVTEELKKEDYSWVYFSLSGASSLTELKERIILKIFTETNAQINLSAIRDEE